MSILDTAKKKYEGNEAVLIAFVLGLILGPIISNTFGWQVSRGTSEAHIRAAVVEQQALFCVERVKATGQDTSGFEYSALKDIAKEWSVMPGQDAADYDVTYACSEKLGVK
ncbi:MAG: hypothetical protein QGI13_12685 [Rhodospirillales bacterium]|nr:hypothetical protein [Rhodospirillales bacterium]